MQTFSQIPLVQSGHLSEDSNFNIFLDLFEKVFAWESLTTVLKIMEQLFLLRCCNIICEFLNFFQVDM